VINAIKFSIEEIEASDQYFDHTRCWRDLKNSLISQLLSIAIPVRFTASRQPATKTFYKSFGVAPIRKTPSYIVLIVASLVATPSDIKSGLASSRRVQFFRSLRFVFPFHGEIEFRRQLLLLIPQLPTAELRELFHLLVCFQYH
jgi:hypothetical protein